MWFPILASLILVVINLAPLARSAPMSGLGHLHVPFHKIQIPIKSKRTRRSFTEIELLHESNIFYSALLKIGTPGQEIPVVLDTGSADLWVASSQNPFCLNEEDVSANSSRTYNGYEIEPSIDCGSLGTFDSSLSSSITKLDIGRFFINYSDGSLADGYWANEKMSISGIDISGLQFGVAEYATAPVGGVLGIGFARRESVRGYENAPGKFYPNFPQVLHSEGVIDVAAYSLYLSEANGDSGSILFGAVDSARFQGPLYTFPMVNEYPEVVDKPATLAMTLQGIGAKSDKKCKSETFSTTKLPVLLDSGTTFMSAPPEIAEGMASFLGATFSESDGVYVFPCPSEDDDTEFVFDFGDLRITAPLSNFLLLPPSNGYCGLGVMPAPYSMTLGSAFLSSAYVVYDLDNYQISLAQSHHGGSDSSLENEVIKVGKHGEIPGATKATAAVWTTDETVAVDHDIFESSISCEGFSILSSSANRSQATTISSRSTLSELESATLSLQVDATPLSSDDMQAKGRGSVDGEIATDSTTKGNSPGLLPHYATTTRTVTAIQTIISTVYCSSD